VECPVSFISGESMALLEDFYAQHVLGAPRDVRDWPARRVDAFAVLRGELRKVSEAG